MTANEVVAISEVAPSEAPLDLLLLADPSVERVRDYLAESRCFIACHDGTTVGACVVKPISGGAHEIDEHRGVANYPEPLFESGIQLKDMLRLTLQYPSRKPSDAKVAP